MSTGSDALWRAAADAMSDSAAVLDRDGVILAVNAAWRRMAPHAALGVDRVGESYLDVCDRSAPEEPAASRAARAIRSVLSQAVPVAWSEYELDERWYRMTVRVCDDPVVPHAAAAVRHEDITERLVSELAAEAARTYLDAVTDSMGEGLFVLDAEGRVRMMNPAAEEMLGWSFEAIEGQVMHDLTHFLRQDGSDYARSDCPILDAYEAGKIIRVSEDDFIRRDGSRLPVAYTASPLEVAGGRGGCVVVFMDVAHVRAEEERLRRQVAELSWIHRVEEALDQDRLILHAQPIVRLSDGEVVQRELLLRVREPDGTVSPPQEYLRTAERYGLIGRIDRWVIRRAVEYAATGVSVEVNVSAASLSDPSLLEELSTWGRESGIDPALLTFEITETAVISDEAAARAFVGGLRELGHLIALDDFGAGYGGFTYLKHLPVDFLKIDREFVQDLAHNERSWHVVQAVVNLARGFGLQTVAEGVEDEVALQLLRDVGVDMAQGFHLGRPAPLHLPATVIPTGIDSGE